MKDKILITDSLFIFPEHEQKLRAAGFEIERLDKPKATEEELIAAIKDKTGYILGGIEHVTDKVIDAADILKAIVFTGAGHKEYIPAWERATEKGIAIATAPGGNAQAVAEWAITMSLAMNRSVFELGRAGDKTFLTTKGLEDQKIGIIGLGRIGSRIAEIAAAFRPASISYFSRHRHSDEETRLDIKYKEMDELLADSDVLFICVSKDAGEGYIGKTELAKIKDGSLVVNFVAEGIVEANALFEELKAGRLRAVSDYPIDDRFSQLPISNWYSFNASNAFNTLPAIRLTSDMATDSLINLLTTGEDKNLVNPEYKNKK